MDGQGILMEKMESELNLINELSLERRQAGRERTREEGRTADIASRCGGTSFG